MWPERQHGFTEKYKVVENMRRFMKVCVALVLLLVVGAAVIYKRYIYDYYRAVIN